MTIPKSQLWRGVAFVAGFALVVAPGVVHRYARYQHDCGRATTANEIVMVSGEDLNPGRRRQQLIKAWNDSVPTTGKMPARLIELPGGADQERAQLLAAQQLRSCTYDVLSLDVVWIPEFIRAGYLEEFLPSEFNRNQFLDKPWQAGTGDDGRQYAIPYHSDVGLLYYRKDIVPKQPRTWEDLRRAVTKKALSKLGGKDPAGLATQLADYEGLTVNGMEAIWGAGGKVEWRNNKMVVDNAAATGLRRLTDGMASSVIIGESAEFRESHSLEAFTDDRVLFLRNWPFAYQVIAADPLLKKRFGVAELPGPAPGSTPGSGALGGHGLAIPKNALHKKEARELIAFLTEPVRQQQLFACGGYVPVRKEVYQNVKACSQVDRQVPPDSPEVGDPVSQEQLQELAGILDAALERARLRPDVPYYPAFSRAFHRYLHDSLTQGTVIDAPTLADRLTDCSQPTSPQAACP
ncbi:MAG TPA: extracellular solute-binding protein [Streptosporangiaceae bacterium]|nr:extracellular solute-binding protein [Streptosporangiaceae bacterium]